MECGLRRRSILNLNCQILVQSALVSQDDLCGPRTSGGVEVARGLCVRFASIRVPTPHQRGRCSCIGKPLGLIQGRPGFCYLAADDSDGVTCDFRRKLAQFLPVSGSARVFANSRRLLDRSVSSGKLSQEFPGDVRRCTSVNYHRPCTVTCHADVLGWGALGCPTSACQRFVLNQRLGQALFYVPGISLRCGCWLLKQCLFSELLAILERLRDSGLDVAREELLDILIRMLHLGRQGGRLMETRACVAC